MTKTKNERELLVVAVQDLHAGEMAWHARLPALHGKTGPALAAFIEVERRRAARQAQQLVATAAQLGCDPNGAPNLWLNAVLDDAERDAVTIVAGSTRDIALVGALRKGKQSKRVSYETALGLAAKLGEADIASALTAIRDEESDADADLCALLASLLA